MPTKLSTYCEKVIEAGWLAAVISVPLFFNVWSSRVFEPDKLTLLRSIALVMITAWLVKTMERAVAKEDDRPKSEDVGLSLLQRRLRTPIVLPTVLLIVVYIVSTITSVVPRVSLGGSYQRLQGTYTTLSYITIFFLMLGNLRTKEQLDRLLNAIVITSLPIALYGLLQHNQLDPLPWAGDVTFRVASNMGNSIFVAAYLIMVVPLTFARMIRSAGTAVKGHETSVKVIFGVGIGLLFCMQVIAWALVGFTRGLMIGLIFMVTTTLFSVYLRRPVAPFLRMGTCALILAAQLVCIFFTQSRGPILGLLGALPFFLLLWTIIKRRRRVALAIVGFAVILASVLLLLNIPTTPFPGFRKIPYVGRLGRLLEIESGTGKVRALIWDGAINLITSDPLRLVIGYGPESMYVAYNKFYPPELAHYEARNASPDRSHNETLDALVITGVTGFVVYMFLFTSIFYYGLKWLGLVNTKRQSRLFAVLAVGGALLGLLLPRWLDGTWRFAGVGIPAGFIVGLFAYLFIHVLFFEVPEGQGKEGNALLLVALLASIVGHFIEIHFGIAIAATRTYFWVFAAIMVLLGTGQFSTVLQPIPAAMPRKAPSRSRGRRRRKSSPVQARQSSPSLVMAFVSCCLVAAMILTIAGFDYITNPTGDPNAVRVIWSALSTMNASGSSQPSFGLFWLFAVTWLAGGFLCVASAAEQEKKALNGEWWLRRGGTYAVITVAIPTILVMIHVSRLKVGMDAGTTIILFYIVIILLLLVTALALFSASAHPLRKRKRGNWLNWLMYAGLAGMAVLTIFITNVSPIRADVYYKQAWEGYHKKAEGYAYYGLSKDERVRAYEIAIALYQQAIHYAPTQDHYYLFKGKGLLEWAEITSDKDTKLFLLEEGQATLERARELNPLNTDHTANLARLNRIRGNMATDQDQRRDFFLRSSEYYRQAVELSPSNAQLYNEWGLICASLGDQEQAMQRYQQSLALDEQFYQTYLLIGDLYLAQNKLPEAEEAYLRVLELRPKQIQTHSSLGYIYSLQGKIQEALRENLIVAESVPGDYPTRKNLSILYQQLGQIDEAIAEATTALDLAPEGEKASMEEYLEQLKQLRSGG